jgi:hypothetical protein
MSKFRLAMISAGFEHGGNVMHRHLDGHSRLLVYPFESQLGNKDFTDFLASIERVQYRYPEFAEGLSAGELYEQIVDEEMKTFLRKRNGSKFREADLVLDERDRIEAFRQALAGDAAPRRRSVIEAFFRSTFAAWRNHHTPVRPDSVYVGYSPAIGLDAPRMIRDFPDIRIIHVVRNPFSAYRDTKRRPFPQPLSKYLITWNVYHSTVQMYARMYPENVRIVRYEDLVADKASFMQGIAAFLGVEFEPVMLYPSWNAQELRGDIAPWGTVLRSTTQYNEDLVAELSDAERFQITVGTEALARHFGYDKLEYLSHLYRAEQAASLS